MSSPKIQRRNLILSGLAGALGLTSGSRTNPPVLKKSTGATPIDQLSWQSAILSTREFALSHSHPSLRNIPHRFRSQNI